MARFTVDTHLFRELGELLVGRDSTALVELIKNAYDADATEVAVHGEHLDTPGQGRILVVDDGNGMDAAEFELGFLRVASRLKEEGERRSARFHRRYTGAKGIGRLAAHKLARKLEVTSRRRVPPGTRMQPSLYASIDWDEIEHHETLDDLDSTEAILLDPKESSATAGSGTTLVLSRLRRGWTPAERARFFAEVQSFDAPAFLRSPLSRSIVEEPLLFSSPVVRDQRGSCDASDSSFRVNLEGEFAAGESYWDLVAGIASWVLEIRAAPGDDQVRVAIAPTQRTRAENPDAERLEKPIPHPDQERGPFFDARVLVREGRFDGGREQRTWASRSSGVRVYLEGFRVLPYGESKDDWLAIDADYTRRPRQLEMLQPLNLDMEGGDADAGLIRLPNNNYFGGVFLVQDRCPTLRTLVNREGFVPEAGFDTLVKLVRTGIDLCTRARAAAARERRETRKQKRRADPVPAGGRANEQGKDEDERLALPERLEEAVALMKTAHAHLSAGETGDARDSVTAALRKVDAAEELAGELISERSLLHVLASVGTQMAAFVHEINALLGSARTVARAIEQLLGDAGLSRDQRRTLTRVLNLTTDLERGLERQASYLMEIENPDARRRRSRQRFRERFDAASRLVQHQAERIGIVISNTISPDLRSLPMFPAELTAIFANLLTNAVKAAGVNGRILASADDRNDQVRIRIQNTGAEVSMDQAERWFKPFQSTTSEVDPVLGQGMGLGLPITRNLLEYYGGVIVFVPPDEPYRTAVEMTLPGKDRS